MLKSCKKCGSKYDFSDNIRKMRFKNICQRCWEVEKESNLLVMVQINKGNIEETFEASKLRGIALSPHEKHLLTKKFLEKKWHYCGSELLEAQNTALAKTYMVRFAISGNPSYLRDAAKAASVATKDTIGFIIETLAKEGFDTDNQ